MNVVIWRKKYIYSPYIPFFPLSVHYISFKRMLSFDIFSETKEERRRYRWFKMIFVPHNDYFLFGMCLKNNPWYDTRTKILKILKKLLDKSNVSVF